MSVASRERLIESVNSKNDAELFTLLRENKSKESSVDLEDWLQALQHSQVRELWRKLCDWISEILLSNVLEGDEGTPEDQKKASGILGSIISLAIITVCIEDPFVPEELLEAAVILHGVLPSLPDFLDEVKNGIARLCEAWQVAELEESDSLTSNTIVYLLARSLRPKAAFVDIVRVVSMSGAIQQHVQAGNETVTNMLLHCMIRREYLLKPKASPIN
ncbi:PREDICTED: condensin-2 complex subunit G2-like [Priapulus caudatus]|uniref:Condensin-2 complex subunit G2-like n=1 Tax=Priapulus caudatus TaxID=37621 RepID=A0ABM1DTQ5_PRICU|nr:PREDICTED: condensin-2 complex subunit G2-like [Priapulus caudatus]